MMHQVSDTEQTGQTAASNQSDRPTSAPDRSDRSSTDWLQQCIEHYQDKANDMCEAIEDFGDIDKLGQGFTLADPMEKNRYWRWYCSQADFCKCKFIGWL